MSASGELCTPPEIVEAATATIGNLLPQKSKDVYNQYYQQFMDWRREKGANSFSENVMVAYFNELSSKMKSSTLWKIYSMLRSTINIKHNIDLPSYAKLRAFLKRQSDGFQAKKSKTLTAEEINTFINEAPDDIYFATKVALIVGIMGVCRKHELWQMKTDHIQDLGTAILIRVPDTKTKVERKFTITGHFCTIFKKYWALQPASIENSHFFINYQKGRCTKQVIGINKFGSMPKQVAMFLRLSNPEQYTGHCFRRTSATMLVDAGADVTTLKRHGGWKSTEVAESYIDDSLNSRMNIANKILGEVTPQTQTSKSVTSTRTSMQCSENLSSESLCNTPNFNFTNCHQITIQIINKNEDKENLDKVSIM